MYQRIIHHTHSIKYALEGLFWAYKEHKNYQIHLILSAFSIILGLVFYLSRLEWMILVITIVFGFVIETINTAIETTLDVIDKTIRKDIKVAKDVSAAAMLIYSFGALIVGFILFIPKLLF